MKSSQKQTRLSCDAERVLNDLKMLIFSNNASCEKILIFQAYNAGSVKRQDLI